MSYDGDLARAAFASRWAEANRLIQNKSIVFKPKTVEHCLGWAAMDAIHSFVEACVVHPQCTSEAIKSAVRLVSEVGWLSVKETVHVTNQLTQSPRLTNQDLCGMLEETLRQKRTNSQPVSRFLTALLERRIDSQKGDTLQSLLASGTEKSIPSATL